ncbi:MAG: M3 family oligoendopeptidase [Proteobacteria bacterium]|nr:M3 family oligoendopeptidase [Pseudomonadota bacterium]MBU1714749.1 M3 family oligoendopeptidase [Pseudomonadota bacterium]
MPESNSDILNTAGILWNLNDLYSATSDSNLEQDIKWCKTEAAEIKKIFAGNIARIKTTDLFSLVSRLEKLDSTLGKISTFAFLNFATKTKDAAAGAFLQEIKETGSMIGKEVIFFELEWSKTDDASADRLMKDEKLSHYRHYLSNMRRYAKHLLSHAEETLLLERAPVGRSSWNNLFDKVMGYMKFGESERTEEEVLADLYNQDQDVRRQAAKELTDGLKSQLHVLTHIFNTILADKMIDDRIRSYGSWVSSMNLYNELQDKTVEVLVDAVTSRYDIPQRYYRLKKQLTGLPELKDYDRYAPLPHLSAQTIPWQECQTMVLEAFDRFSPQMADTAKLFFDRNWIHAPIIEGKRGGAFAHPCVPEVHPYVMVNYTGNLRDVSTVAHELGHGVHQYLAAAGGYYNSNTTLVLAETASVFGELILFNAQVDRLQSPEEKRAFVCQKLESIFATVFRQVSMNRFENLIHNTRRDKGELSSDDFATHWLTTQNAMFGDSVNLTEDYGIWWSYIPHFLSTPGYVYSYAFGELLVLALYNLYQQDPVSFVPKYINLLKSGGSNSPYELLKPFKVDLDDRNFWDGGLQTIDDMLKTVEI